MKNLLLTVAASIGFAAASMGQTLPAYLPSDGLVGWWPFNGNANDESGNGNDGTVNGAALTTDRFGNANCSYSFDGTGNNIAASCDGFSTNQRTLSVWFKGNDIGAGYSGRSLLGYGGDGICGTSCLVMIDNAATGGNKYEISGHCANEQVYFDYGENHPNDYWVHWVISVDSTDGTSFYLDGQLVHESSTYIQQTYTSNKNLYFGTIVSFDGNSPFWDSNSMPFNGSLDDIAIYNRALTPEEITALYNAEPVNPPTTCNPLPANLQNGLVGYWPFCGNANDESGNGNDGTVNGATLTEDRFGVANSAYSFDGVNDYIEASNSASLTFNQNRLSISYWINVIEWPQPNAVEDYLISKHSLTGNDQTGFHTYIYGGNNTSLQNYISFRYRDGIESNWNPGLNSTNPDLSNGNWYNLIVTHDENFDKMYFNGILVDSSFSVALGGNNTAPLLFGCLSNYTYNYNGILDDIGIWNRALTADEVQQLYTLNACTFTVYDTTHVTVYDTVTTYTTVTDTLIINTLITSLAPPANTNTIKVFPNPAGSFLTIDYGNFALMSGYQLRIENSLGQQVFQTNINQQSDTLSLATWGGNGLYFVHIVDPQGNTIDIRKIVLQ